MAALTFNAEEVKPFSFNRLEKTDIPEERRVISIWRKMREVEDAKSAELAAEQAVKDAAEAAAAAKVAAARGPKYPPVKPPEPKGKAPEPNLESKAAKAPAVPAEGEAPAEAELPPPPKLNLRPRKPDRPGFKRMVSAEERPKGSFTGFATSSKAEPGGVRTLILDHEREAEEEAEKTAAEKRAELMAQAQAEAAALKQRAQAEGQQQGYAQGLAKAREEVRAELMPVLQKFAAATQDMLNQRAGILRASEREILELTLLIGKKVLHAELRLHPEAVAQVVRHALGRAIGWGSVRVRVNPEDAALLEEVKDSLSAQVEGVTIAEFVPSPSVARGGCTLESNLGEVDVRLELQLGEVERALRQALDERLRAEAEPAAQTPSEPSQPAGGEAPAGPPRPEAQKAPDEVQAQPYRPRELGDRPPKPEGAA
ncbi:MAG: hypothetical protein HYZ11_15310 [Candidatus Tectomicrobia bacterium]|uniref:Flagellar assembly protein FliH n=1 Tax=Tectimicrobiota bacterium TaxID=2528274 RepID=A0A932I2M7_UNCTE|nr:hypothetical protein [Candidatus Tectomicrobia bacterium]